MRTLNLVIIIYTRFASSPPSSVRPLKTFSSIVYLFYPIRLAEEMKRFFIFVPPSDFLVCIHFIRVYYASSAIVRRAKSIQVNISKHLIIKKSSLFLLNY